MTQRFFFGRPPFLPFLRAAAALAALVDCPPLLPSSLAASRNPSSWMASPKVLGGMVSIPHEFGSAMVAALPVGAIDRAAMGAPITAGADNGRAWCGCGDALEGVMANADVLIGLFRGQWGGMFTSARGADVAVDAHGATVGASVKSVFCHALKISEPLGFVKMESTAHCRFLKKRRKWDEAGA